MVDEGSEFFVAFSQTGDVLSGDFDAGGLGDGLKFGDSVVVDVLFALMAVDLVDGAGFPAGVVEVDEGAFFCGVDAEWQRAGCRGVGLRDRAGWASGRVVRRVRRWR